MTHTSDNTLLTSETWSDYQALQLIETQLGTSLARLNPDQRQRYLQLCRIEPKARGELAEALQRFKHDFESNAYHELAALLREECGQTLDLNHTWLHTRMTELPERKGAKDPIELLGNLFSSRSKRSLANHAPREHVVSKTLWQVAKENFAFNLATNRLHSGLDFQRASSINTSHHDPHSSPVDGLSVIAFVRVIRQYDFATRLHHALALHLASTLDPLIFAHRKAGFELDVLEAIRRQTEDHPVLDTGSLMQALTSTTMGLRWRFFQMQFGAALLGEADTLALPFCVMKLADGNGVFSYFPNRPKGALRHHADTAQAIRSLREQISADAKANRIDWLLRTLSLTDQVILLEELKSTAVDESQLNWLARQLYRAFGDQGSAAERIDLRAESPSTGSPPHSLLSAMEQRQSRTLARDLLSIATTASGKDWEQVKKTLLYIGSEILELLTLPAPGGVTGLNRIMITASLGTLAYNTVTATAALARGQSTDFIQAVGDIADLVISSRIQGVGARLSTRRTQQLVSALGKPRAAELPSGEQGLWLADLHPYTVDPKVLTGATPDSGNLFERGGKRYAQVRVGNRIRVGEVHHDPALNQYRLKHPDPRQYQPVLSYDQGRGYWRQAAVDVSQLSPAELLHSMLRPDLPALTDQDIGHLLILTGIERAQLEAIWKGETAPPWPLAHATRDLQTRRGLEQLQLALDSPDLPLPAFADYALPPLLADQIKGQVIIYGPDRSTRLSHHCAVHGARPGIAIELVQTAPGQYRGLGDASNTPTISLLHAALMQYQHYEPGQTQDTWRQQTADNLRHSQHQLHAALLEHNDWGDNHAQTRPLRQRFVQLPEAAARELLVRHPALKDITRHSPLEAEQLAAIQQARTQGRLIHALNALNDPGGRNLGADAEAIACNLLTTLGGWPDDLNIKVYRGQLDFSGRIDRTRDLLAIHGDESAAHSIMLVKFHEHYAGYDQNNSDMLQPLAAQYPLASMLLRVLSDKQRDSLGLSLQDSARLAQTLLSQAHIHSASLPDLLPSPTTFDLSAERLAPFQLTLDLSGILPDSNGLYAHDGKLHARIDGEFFQVLHDLDASSPGRRVMRIVRPDEPVAIDPQNLYVASRPGRSEPITRDETGAWFGAVTGLSGGAPKTDRLHEMREKTKTEENQTLLAANRFFNAHVQLVEYLQQPETSTYFLMAGADYLQLKRMSQRNLGYQVLQHRKIAATDFRALSATLAQKRETLTKTVADLENIAHAYSEIADIYKTVGTLELETAQQFSEAFDLNELPAPHRPMQAANENLIAMLETFKSLAVDEIDRLLLKLEELPAAAQVPRRARPAPGKKKKKTEKPSTSTPQPATTPKNRVEIRTQDDQLLSGKPRTDNPNIVDILDSRGQRKATYLLSSDKHYWVEYSPTQPPSGSTASASPAWASYDDAAQKLFDEARHSESVADYLGRKKDATPSAPEGLLEYQANRLEEHAREIHDALVHLTNAGERQQAESKITELQAMARTLRNKGRTLRVDLIISNNAPTANDLQYLAESDNLQVRKTRQDRIALERDHIDEFELKIKDRDLIWAYAHLHYGEPDSDGLLFNAAHLKRPEQRFQGAQLQGQEARAGRRYEIHRGVLYSPQVQQILLSGRHRHASAEAGSTPAPTTFELGTERLAALRINLDFSTSAADSNGLHQHNGKLYVQIRHEFFQVVRDLDASSPAHPVMRIVRPEDPVAVDPRNLYVASRPGRSEPITLDERGLWVGAITGLAGGGAKVDRRKELVEKTVLEYIRYSEQVNRFADAKEQFDDLPGARVGFLPAGNDYFQLKSTSYRNLVTQIRRHDKIAATNFNALPATMAQKREALIKNISALEHIAHGYNHLADVYSGINALEQQARQGTLINFVLTEQQRQQFAQMQSFNNRIIPLLERFRTLALDELDRLLVKLDEFPEAAAPLPKRKPGTDSKKKKPGKPAASAPRPAPAPKNRVDIRTEDDKILSAKPRIDNANVVDILDSRGQRKATYLLSSDGQYWIEYLPTPLSTPANGGSSPAPLWSTYEAAVHKLLDEARHSESVADYLGRKKDSTPSAPEGLLEYQANRLDEQAREIQDLLTQLTSAEDRQQAQASVTRLNAQARVLRAKGRTLRIDLIISNNAPGANDLQYLVDTDNLLVRKTRADRIPMERAGSSRQQAPRDYIDEFELTIKNRDQVWAYAHVHHAQPDSDALAFSAAHLKRPEQRFQGAQVQTQEAQAGRRYDIHRGALHKAQVQDVLLSGLYEHEASTLELRAERLAAFRVNLGLSTSTADSHGLHRHDGKLYVNIHGEFFQVMHDLDASSPERQVMRIVKPGDPVASDEHNTYVATRPGRSEAITRNEQGGWVGAVTGLRGGAPKADRLKALREKTAAEEDKRILILSGFHDALTQLGSHLKNPAGEFYFMQAGMDYFQLKRSAGRQLSVLTRRHARIVVTDFNALPTTAAQKREALNQAIDELEKTVNNYSTIMDVYISASELEVQTLEQVNPGNLDYDRDYPRFRKMLEANKDIIVLIERFKGLANDEIDRLLIKLDDFPEPAAAPPRSRPTPGTSRKKPEKAPAAAPRPTPAPKNRIEIRTEDDKVLSGKPRSDNSNIVDIFDSRGQRTATYLLSGDGQHWVEYVASQPSSTSTGPAPGPSWASYAASADTLLAQVRHSESVAEYLGRKKGATPSSPEGLLEYQANRLEEHAREIQDLLMQLTSAEERRQAQDSTTQLREKARLLRQKGRALRLDLIIANNTPCANDLQYLADTDNLLVTKTHQERIAIKRAGTSRQQAPEDYIDEYALKIREGERIWAYAHLHYSTPDSDALAYNTAHLKRPEQRYQGAQLQILEAQAGRRYEIHRGTLGKAQVQDIVLAERFEQA